MAEAATLDLSVIVTVDPEGDLGATVASLGVFANETAPHVQVVVAHPADREPDPQALADLRRYTRFQSVDVVAATDGDTTAAARNAGLAAANGVWALLLCAGDELLCDPLPLVDRHPAATAILFAHRLRRGKRDRRQAPPRITSRNRLNRFTAANPVGPAAVLLRRAFLKYPFDRKLPHLDDWLFWLLNLAVFDRPVREPKVALTRTSHAADQLDRRGFGETREQIADRMLRRLRFHLSRKQRHNLALQAACGLKQQGRRAPFRTLLRFPCNPTLYVKRLSYFLMGRMAASP